MKNKTLKFRAWDKRTQTMHKTWVIDFRPSMRDNNSWCMVQKEHELQTPEDSWGNTKDFIELMQFTGLNDKNGKEIFEGDIIRFYEPDAGWVFEVVYVPEKACYSLSSPNRFMDIMAASFTAKLTEIYAGSIMEIIGNIYENPQLLG